jgi:hypothetical protein
MPADQQTIDNLIYGLETLTNTIYDTQIAHITTSEAIEEANEHIETMKAAMMSQIFNERFEINNKLVYTNDDQRKVALIEMQKSDADFIAMKNARTNAAALSATQKAEIEKNRNLHKTKLLELEYYAKLS